MGINYVCLLIGHKFEPVQRHAGSWWETAPENLPLKPRIETCSRCNQCRKIVIK